MNSRFCSYLTGSSTGEILEADAILPCQYFDVSGGRRLSGEQRLMLALLTDAINVYRKGVLSRLTRDRLLYIDAERWFMDDHAARNVFSFATVCEALGIDPRLLRRQMIVWKHRVNHEAKDARAPQLRSKIMSRRQRIIERHRRTLMARAV